LVYIVAVVAIGIFWGIFWVSVLINLLFAGLYVGSLYLGLFVGGGILIFREEARVEAYKPLLAAKPVNT
jgi:hypothetical protein